MPRRRQRRRNPLPDPAWLANDALSERLVGQAAPGQPLTCQWNGCPKPRSFYLAIPICDAHAKIVTDEVIAVRELRRRARAESEADYQKGLAENTARIEAGQPPEPDKPIPGWVYYIRVDTSVKIGYAKDVTTRMRAYPPNAELLAIEPGTKKTERARHQQFAAYLDWGREWFTPSDELMAHIAALTEQYDHRPYTYRYRRARTQLVGIRHNRGVKKTA